MNGRSGSLLTRCFIGVTLQPQRSLELLSTWLSIDFQEAMLAPGQNSISHILAGNRVRFDAERSRTIAYDGACCQDRHPRLPIWLAFARCQDACADGNFPTGAVWLLCGGCRLWWSGPVLLNAEIRTPFLNRRHQRGEVPGQSPVTPGVGTGARQGIHPVAQQGSAHADAQTAAQRTVPALLVL